MDLNITTNIKYHSNMTEMSAPGRGKELEEFKRIKPNGKIFYSLDDVGNLQ